MFNDPTSLRLAILRSAETKRTSNMEEKCKSLEIEIKELQADAAMEPERIRAAVEEGAKEAKSIQLREGLSKVIIPCNICF